MIGKSAENAINRAVRFAMESEHEYFTLEHILWSLIQEADVSEVLETCGARIEILREDLIKHLEIDVPKLMKRSDSGDGEQPVATLAVQRLIQRALFQVQSSGKDEIRPLDLLVALFNAKDSVALHLMQKQRVQRIDILRSISQLGSKSQSDTGENGAREERRDRQSSDAIKEYLENLNEKALKGKIDPVIGRDLEVERMIQTLCRRRKNNPLLVGEAGVGKTAIAEGLAVRIIEKQVPSLLENAVVFSLDLGTLLAGAKFRGDFEQRLKKVLEAIEKQAEKNILPILFIDEIHTLIGAGSVHGSALDAANLLKPILAQGGLRCIGSTTFQEYRTVFEKDHALNRRFQKIEVGEPSIPDSIKILQGLQSRFEDFHSVKFTEDAVRLSVEMSAKYITDRFLPDKAIDVIDEAGAKKRIQRSKDQSINELIDGAFIEEIISQIARIPARSISVSQKDRLKNLERDLKIAIFGQDPSIQALVTAIRLSKSGLRSGDKPIGSFLLCGPTGVGKTELSKQLAHALGIPFLRFDMSEYSERHTVSRLIGAPPGYVGFDQQGLFTNAVLKQPHAVVLLDEIEKAHPEVWNILLQVMDHGTLTDNSGRKVDFRNVILLMTSNVGSRELEKRSLGMITSETAKTGKAASKAVEEMFSPEFRNRLDSILYFNPLDPLTVAQIVGKQILELEHQLMEKNVEIEVDVEVREWLANKGYDRLLGARPLQRLIQDVIKKPLSEALLYGDLENGGSVHLSLSGDSIEFKYEKLPNKLSAKSEVVESPS